MAHAGVVVMIIGVMFSSGSTSTSISLDKGGPSAVAQGYAFSYQGRRPGGPGIEIAEFRAERGGRTFAAPIVMEYTEHQAVRRPYVREGLLSDLYVSPVEIGDRTVTPTASVTDGGWISLPAVVPGTKATLTLLGMQVEQDMAKLRYQPEHGPPVDVEATKGRPVTAAGITFEVRRLLVSSAKDMSSITAGADVALSGGGVAEAAVIQVSVKPLVSLVWLGLILITLGGVLAAARRIRDGSLRSESDSGSA
jgi:cytochrome c-type biogenesis protein CcmF